jgi:hypothetical protein
MATTINYENSVRFENEQLDSGLVPEPFVFVIFTSINGTLKALQKALEIAQPVEAAVAVVALQVVPFPLPLDEPPVPMEFVVKRFQEMAGTISGDTIVSAYLCRNPMEAFKRVLKHNCPVVIGGKKRWLPGRDERLARKLRRAGYDVSFFETE